MTYLPVVVAMLFIISAQPVAVLAQPVPMDTVCFDATGYCISGRFREYWEQNGGLPVFGYPVSPARMEVNRDTGQSYFTQWFERNRFEQHPENEAPYDVLLGRLGDDRLLQLGIDARTIPRYADGPYPGCRWFEETGHNVCDQGNGLGFMSYWQSHGLELGDPGISFRESLALFGLPLTDSQLEVNSSGDVVITQWFERARFEWHDDKPDEYKVLLGLLGNEIRSAADAGAVTIVDNASFYREGADLVILGDVRNDTPRNATAIAITATIYDQHDEVIDRETGYTLVDTLQPGERSPFRLRLGQPPQVFRYQLAVTWQGTDEPAPNRLTILDTGSRPVTGAGERVIYGTLRNDTGRHVVSTEVIATLYNSAGKVVGVETVLLDDLAAGQTMGFEVAVPDWRDATTYEVIAWATRG